MVAIILLIGAVSGAHLNPAVTVAFALRRDFHWRRAPGYVLAQLTGSIAACALLHGLFGGHHDLGASHPGAGFAGGQAFLIEALLTLGLIPTVLGTASTPQNIGSLSAFAVGAYIIAAGQWAGPVSGASMNPARSLGPALITGDYHDLWIYLAGPAAGLIMAVAAATILRGPGGDPDATTAASGKL